MNNLRKILLTIFALVTAVFAPSAMNAQSGSWSDESNRDTNWGSDYENASSFTINSAEQLAQLAYMVNNGSTFEEKTITLTANIDLAGHYWTPIGNSNKDFRGTFEGDNKTISNLTINTTAQYQGLFGSLASAFVRNVNLVGCNITAGSITGGIAGDAGWTTISNCSVSGEIHSAGTSSHNYGGIVGTVSGSSYGNLIIIGNTNTASVSATANGYAVGGIVGYFGRTTKFRNNFSTGVVSGSDHVGTLIGMIDEDDYNEFTNNCYPANANLTGAVGSSDASTGHDIEGASVGFTISAGDGVTLSLPTPVKTFNSVDYYMNGTVFSTTAFTVPDGNHFTGYTVNSGSISDANLMIGSHTLTGVTANVTVNGSYAAGEPYDFSEDISIEVENATYDGQAHLQEPVVKMGETTLTKNEHYTVSYSEACINAGEYTLTVTGNGIYTGSKTATFNILPYNINNNNIRVSVYCFAYTMDPSTYERIYYTEYTGNNITINGQDVEVMNQTNYSGLIYNTDFTISTTPSPVNEVGDYTLNINGAGNYTGTKSIPFSVTYPAPRIEETVNTTATTATLTWQDQSANSWEVEYMIYDPSNYFNPYVTVGSVFTTETTITLTNLIPETMYLAHVRGIYNNSQSQWSYSVRFEPSAKITIGESEDDITDLPTKINAQYSVSQQIYTAAEIGQAGTIATIDFLIAGRMPVTRNLDVYMVHTNKTTFDNNSDWISVTDNDKVFSGNVSFNSWTTISLSTPFNYSGNSNLAVIVHDRTGQSQSGMYGSEFGFACFETQSNQALFVSSSTDFNLTSMSAGTPAASKNQIRLFMVDKIISTDGNWNEAANWNPSCVPTSSDVAIVNANVTIPSGCVAQASIVSVGNGSLTIEEGGQLICSNAAPVTVKKTIGAWTTGDPVGGWYFIASPLKENVMPSEVGNLLTTETQAPYSFDLYRLNGTTWENYHDHSTDNDDPYAMYDPDAEVFFLENGQGYLYANESQVSLQFTGTTKPYTAGYTVEANSWNLVGNPYTFNAYVNQPHYVLNSTRTAIVAAENNSAAIAPCTGVIVNGNATFYNEPLAQSNNQGNIQIALAQTAATRGGSNMETLDNAIVSFNEGNELSKFYFGTQAANIYIPQGTEEYAIAYSNAQGEMPVNFKANQDGEYTLSINANDAEMSYLHLIDNMTGADIDLLQTPSYTFTAKTSDYESRFRLMFASNVDTDGNSDSFAFFSNGNWIIANEGQATLQVIDITGRILSSESINGSVSKAIDATAGVYMIRLVNGENVKVQKIVVK